MTEYEWGWSSDSKPAACEDTECGAALSDDAGGKTAARYASNGQPAVGASQRHGQSANGGEQAHRNAPEGKYPDGDSADSHDPARESADRYPSDCRIANSNDAAGAPAFLVSGRSHGQINDG